MKYKLLFYLFILFGLLLAGCADVVEEGASTTGSENDKNFEIIQTESIDEEGDFIYRLATEKSEYSKHGDVNIYAEIEYVGELDEIKIYHAASPFYFPMVEKTRNYNIYYPMNQPLVSTTLVKGEPFREVYTKSGFYTEEDDESYKNFMKELWEKGFPSGVYVVYGSAQFYVEVEKDGQVDEVDYELSGEIEFRVN